MAETSNLITFFKETRAHSEELCSPLEVEDYVVQPVVDVSPPKWHLGHTTWFFEEFMLTKFDPNYQRFDSEYAFVFNSYYESLGARLVRKHRGNLSRPTVQKVYEYRRYVTNAMVVLLGEKMNSELIDLVIIGIHHEKQHQELLLSDIKYILGNNPLFPIYDAGFSAKETLEAYAPRKYEKIASGLYSIGHTGADFCYDNELGTHQVYLEPFEVATTLVLNSEYLDFILDGGYTNAMLWHAEGWDWVQKNKIAAPLYWYQIDSQWHQYTLRGLLPLEHQAPVAHISYYEAFAYAQWCGQRLPTEFEWEVAQSQFPWGARWEWTESAYVPYPGYVKAPGALGEYNGKFMVNQKVLRGGSIVTASRHTRPTYRNFFHPQLRWQFTGIRLVK